MKKRAIILTSIFSTFFIGSITIYYIDHNYIVVVGNHEELPLLVPQTGYTIDHIIFDFDDAIEDRFNQLSEQFIHSDKPEVVTLKEAEMDYIYVLQYLNEFKGKLKTEQYWKNTWDQLKKDSLSTAILRKSEIYNHDINYGL